MSNFTVLDYSIGIIIALSIDEKPLQILTRLITFAIYLLGVKLVQDFWP